MINLWELTSYKHSFNLFILIFQNLSRHFMLTALELDYLIFSLDLLISYLSLALCMIKLILVSSKQLSLLLNQSTFATFLWNYFFKIFILSFIIVSLIYRNFQKLYEISNINDCIALRTLRKSSLKFYRNYNFFNILLFSSII